MNGAFWPSSAGPAKRFRDGIPAESGARTPARKREMNRGENRVRDSRPILAQASHGDSEGRVMYAIVTVFGLLAASLVNVAFLLAYF